TGPPAGPDSPKVDWHSAAGDVAAPAESTPAPVNGATPVTSAPSIRFRTSALRFIPNLRPDTGRGPVWINQAAASASVYEARGRSGRAARTVLVMVVRKSQQA